MVCTPSNRCYAQRQTRPSAPRLALSKICFLNRPAALLCKATHFTCANSSVTNRLSDATITFRGLLFHLIFTVRE